MKHPGASLLINDRAETVAEHAMILRDGQSCQGSVALRAVQDCECLATSPPALRSLPHDIR